MNATKSKSKQPSAARDAQVIFVRLRYSNMTIHTGFITQRQLDKGLYSVAQRVVKAVYQGKLVMSSGILPEGGQVRGLYTLRCYDPNDCQVWEQGTFNCAPPGTPAADDGDAF